MKAQIITEQFNYTPDATNGLAKQSSSAWTVVNTGDSVLVTSGSLSYSNLSAPIGNKISYDGAGTDYLRTFTAQSTVGTTVYYSLILNVSSLGSMNTTGGYTLMFAQTTNYAGCIWLRKSSVDATKYNIGLSTRSNTTVSWLSTDYVVGTSYFVVVGYQIISGTGNDVSKIWINPTLGNSTEPSADATGVAGTDMSSISGFLIRQDAASSTPFVQIDELRIGTTWSVVTPVPTISGSTTATVFTTTYGTASASQSFSVSGTGLTANLVATAPTGYEVSSDGTTYGGTATFTQSSGSSSGTLRVRLKANASVGGSYNSQNIILSSTGATSVNITTASSGNTVTAKALTITGISAANKNYDGNTTVTLNGTAAYSGLVNGESFSVTGTPSASFATAGAGTGKSVTVTGYTAPSSNYSITQPTLTADINPVTLTINGLTGTDKEYDGSISASFSGTPSYSGLVNGESFAVTGSPTSSFVTSTAGSAKTIIVSGYNAPSANYTVTQPTLTANITAKALTITGLTANNKQYDGTTTATLSGTAVLNGVLASDNGNVSLGGTPVAQFASSAVGSNIAVTVTGYSISGSATSNYSLTQPTGLTANITSSSLQNQTITFNALSAVTYGDASFTLNGTASSGLTVTYASSNTSVATISGNTVTIVGAGSANITASQGGNDTYNPAISVTRTLTVNKKSLSVSGASAQNKIYDGNLTAAISGGSLVGIVGSDNVTITGGGSFASAGVGSSIGVTASLSLAGTSATNYTIVQPTGLTASITPKELTITGLTADNKTYDGNPMASLSGIPTLVGVASVDAGNVLLVEDFVSFFFTSSNAGNNIPIIVSDYLLDGSASGNYTLTMPAGLTANILPISLTISGLTANNKIYDGTTTATFSGTPVLNGVLSGEGSTFSLNGTSAVASFTSPTAGNNKTVQLSGYTLSGSGSVNYTLSQPLVLSANITKANVTVTGLTANNKIYDGNTTATLSGTPVLSGVYSGDVSNVTLTGTGVASFADTAAGTAKPVSVSGYSITGTASGNYTFVQPTGLTADITKATQTITFNAIPVKTVYDTTVTLPLNSSANLPISYSSSNTSVATANGNIITIVGAGTTVITASQSGNNNYTAATSVQQNLTVLTALSKWTFEGITFSGTAATTPSITTGSAIADQGILTSGTAFTAFHNSAATTWSTVAGNGSAKSVNCNNWSANDYYQFKVNTTGNKNISVYLDQTGSNTGPRDFKLQYSLNGTTYTDFGSVYAALTNDSWSATTSKTVSNRTFDISSITGINNRSAVYFRVVCDNVTNAISSIFGTGGTNRLDNFLVTGIPCETTSSTQSVTACNSYNWNGTTYTSSGNYTYTTRNSTGCDSLAIVNLTINNSTRNSSSASACNSYNWNGTTYTSSGTYTYNYTNSNGCASTDTLRLTIYTGTFNSITRSVCDSYIWNGTTYTSSGIYTYSYSNSNGCASVDTLRLTITPSTSGNTVVSACDSYTWNVNGTTYTTSGNYTNVTGCVTQILNLTITPSTSHASSASACDSYTWSVNGTTYTTSGTYSSISGCHTEVLNLTITPSTVSTTTTSACDSYTWSVNGQTYTTSGTYSSVSGCHTQILNLTFTSSTTSTSTVTSCDSYTWNVNGTTYTSSGAYTSVIGCATYILNLTIVASTSHTNSVSACDSYTWAVNGQSYTASGSYTSVSGCNTEYLNLTIRKKTTADEIVSACGSYVWHGTTYTTSNNTATWTGTNAAGCDSIVTLRLTIKNATSSTETVSACGTYTWHGTTYTSSTNTATWTGVNAAGCDSVVTLRLTIKNPTSSTETISACGSYTWHGTTYTSSTSAATWTGVNAAGCDSIVTLQLTIKNATTSTTNVTTCGSYTWHGTTYTAGVGANTVLAKWEIPTSIPASTIGTSYSYGAANTGVKAAGTNLSSVHSSSSTTYTSTTGNGSTYAFNASNWTTGDYFQTTVATNGYTDVTVSWDQTRSGTGPGTFDLKMSVDGGSTFTTILAGYSVIQAGGTGTGTTSWNSSTYQSAFTLNANLGAAAANKSSVILRFVTTVTTASAGTSRIDNINISGKQILTGSGTYTYTTTNAVGCDSVATLNLTLIDASPTTSTETISACNSYNWHGTTFTTSNNTATWTGTNASGCDSVVTLNLTIRTGTFNSTSIAACSSYDWHGNTYTSSGIYTYDYNNNYGCASTDTLHLTISLPPAAGTLSGNNAICLNGTTTFSSTISGGSWSSNATGIATINSNTGVITPLSAGSAVMNYTVAGTGGCNDVTATRTVVITALPSAGTLSGSGDVCINGSATFASTVSGGSWSSNATGIAAINSNTGVITPLSAGSAVMTYTVAGTGGCADVTANRTLTVHSLPNPSINNNSGSSQLTCSLTSVSVSASGGVSYVWSDGLGADAIANISSPGTYTVSATDINGCTATANIIISQDISLPSAGITNNSGLNELTCSRTAIEVTATGGGTYVWNNGMGSNATVNITTPGTYTVTVTGSNGCTNTASVIITQDISNPSSGITNLTGTNELNCSTVSIQATATGGTSYSWSNGLGNNASCTISAPGTYTVTVTGANGCQSTSSIVITQNLAQPSITFTNNTGTTEITCSNPSISITAGGAISYVWSGGLGTNAAATITAPGSYTVTATGANGCTATASLSTTQNISLPTASIANNSGYTELTCTLNSISLTASGGVNYSWSNGVSIVGNSATLNVTAPGTYIVTVYGSNGCSSTASQVITQANSVAMITSQPSKIARKIPVGFVLSPLTVTINGIGNYTYQWYQNTAQSNVGGTPISGANSLSYTPSTASASTYFYYLVITSGDGCTTTSEVSGFINVCGQ